MKRGQMKMTEGSRRNDEAFSALIDGELPSDERDRTLDRISSDPRLRARWTRYHASRAAMRGALPQGLRPDFAGRVREALDAEPIITGPARRPRATARRHRARSVTAVAAVAGLAVVMVTGLLLNREAGVSDEPQSRIAVAETGTSPSMPQAGAFDVPVLSPDGGTSLTPAVAVGAPRELGPDVREKVDEYLTSHAAISASGEISELIQSGRVASHRIEP